MRILGIDYGARRIGIAISDESQKLAFPKETIANDTELIENIQALAKREGFKTIVLGHSLNYKREDNAIMEQIRKFESKLKDIGFSVELEDETLSTSMAQTFQEDKENLDARAAAIILQTYLDRINA